MQEELALAESESTQDQREWAEAQRVLEAAWQRYRELYDFAPVGLLDMDCCGSICDANQKAAEFLGRPLAKLMGAPLRLFLPAEAARAWREDFARLRRTKTHETVTLLRISHADRSPRVLEMHTIGSRELTGPVKLRAAIIDVTDRHVPRETAAWLAGIVQSSSDAIYTCDLRGTIKAWNPAAEQLFGYSAEEATGEPLSLIVPRDCIGQIGELLARAADEGAVTFEMDHLRKDGRRFPAWLSLAPMKKPAGGLFGICIVCRDGTEHKRMETALQQERIFLRRVLDTSPALIFVKQLGGRYVLVNEALAKIYGKSADEVIGKTDADFNPDAEQVAHFRQDDDEVISRRRPKLIAEEPARHADGQVRWYGTVKVPLIEVDGTCTRLLGVAMDITERRRSEVLLQKANVELGRRHAEMEELLYTVSHDLKSPLVTIQGFLGYLSQDAKSGRTDRLMDQVRRIQKASDRMARLLDELLNISRIGRVVGEPVLIDLGKLVREVVSAHSEQLDRGGIKVTIQEEMPPLRGDRERIYQVFDNLLVNAIKHGSSAAEPRIEFGARQDGDTIDLFVQDNGKGIAPEYHDKIFKLFHRLEQDPDGVGVGLAIVKKIVEVHGGRVRVESRPGEGATFWMTFPKSIESQAGSPEPSAESHHEEREELGAAEPQPK
ncbi:MAG TPA: PAS domain-containing sensor histidine kinase [Phycisphaerae bacterium]|nr:PAS domain-containing sensor histidine kinase [Phycisphaerae bacterium]